MKTKAKKPLTTIISLFLLIALQLCASIINYSNNIHDESLSILIFLLLLYTSIAVLIITQDKKDFLILPVSLLFLVSFIDIFTAYGWLDSLKALCSVCIFASLVLFLLIETQSNLFQALKDKKHIIDKVFVVALILFCILSPISSMIDFLDGNMRERFIIKFIFEIVCVIPMGAYISSFKNYISPIPEEELVPSQDAFGRESKFFIPLGLHIFLLLITGGVWQTIWVYKSSKFTNLAENEKRRNPSICILFYLFIPIYSIYWIYVTAQRIDKIARKRNVQSELATLCLILAIFIPIIPQILMQDRINHAIIGEDTTKNNSMNEAATIEKYMELYNKGIITAEEFEAKKKQLLGI